MNENAPDHASLDCIPCLCRETVEAVRAATADPHARESILGEALFHLAMRDPPPPPPTGRSSLDFSPARRCTRAD